jgi:hypothetical protein
MRNEKSKRALMTAYKSLQAYREGWSFHSRGNTRFIAKLLNRSNKEPKTQSRGKIKMSCFYNNVP